MKLPADFIQSIERNFGQRGRVFLHALPTLVDEAAERWQLTDVAPAENLSYNFVAYARRAGVEVVLKLGVPDRELTSEVRSLRRFAGQGAVKLLESDSGRGMLLLERLRPGHQLARLTDDAKATRVGAGVMLAIRKPGVQDEGLIQLRDWFRGLERLRERFSGGTGPLDRKTYEQAEARARELLEENHLPGLIHGDLHHFNILSSERGWLAIDPKGVIGPAGYEVGPFLMNPWAVGGLPSKVASLMRDRVAVLAEALGMEQERIRAWGIAHGVLSAVWSLEEDSDWRPAMECARMLSGFDD